MSKLRPAGRYRWAIVGIIIFAMAQLAVTEPASADIFGPAADLLGTPMSGKDLADLISSKDQRGFRLEDRTGGSTGVFEIDRGKIHVVWNDEVSGPLDVRGESDVCAHANEQQRTRCFTLFTPARPQDSCKFYVLDGDFNRVACAKAKN